MQSPPPSPPRASPLSQALAWLWRRAARRVVPSPSPLDFPLPTFRLPSSVPAAVFEGDAEAQRAGVYRRAHAAHPDESSSASASGVLQYARAPPPLPPTATPANDPRHPRHQQQRAYGGGASPRDGLLPLCPLRNTSHRLRTRAAQVPRTSA